MDIKSYIMLTMLILLIMLIYLTMLTALYMVLNIKILLIWS